MSSKIYQNTYKLAMDEALHNDWFRIMEYNSPSGASVAVNAIKNGKTQIYNGGYSGSKVFAFTARTFGDKSRLYAYCISDKGTKPHPMPAKTPLAKPTSKISIYNSTSKKGNYY